jgi:hypothetical protein
MTTSSDKKGNELSAIAITLLGFLYCYYNWSCVMSHKPRAARRREVRHPATLTMTDQSAHDAHTLDLSHGGISLQTASQIRLAQYCAVSFQVQLGEANHSILAMGQVVYSDPDAALGFKTGVQFLRIDNGSVAVIDQLLQE